VIVLEDSAGNMYIEEKLPEFDERWIAGDRRRLVLEDENDEELSSLVIDDRNGG
jgi:hypothetical protein